MHRHVEDRYLPPDHDAFVAAEPPTGRVIVIAPTRAACETIELALGLHIDTYLERTRGAEVRELAASGKVTHVVVLSMPSTARMWRLITAGTSVSVATSTTATMSYGPITW